MIRQLLLHARLTPDSASSRPHLRSNRGHFHRSLHEPLLRNSVTLDVPLGRNNITFKAIGTSSEDKNSFTGLIDAIECLKEIKCTSGRYLRFRFIEGPSGDPIFAE